LIATVAAPSTVIRDIFKSMSSRVDGTIKMTDFTYAITLSRIGTQGFYPLDSIIGPGFFKSDSSRHASFTLADI